jgi:transcriptional regulator with XRE-family HTH domain
MSWRQLGSPPHEELRRLLIERRHRAGLTQTQVAERLGRPQRFISRVERGLHRVTVVELLEFAQALEFDPGAALRRVANAAKR